MNPESSRKAFSKERYLYGIEPSSNHTWVRRKSQGQFGGEPWEKNLLREYDDQGCHHMTWECRHKGRRYIVEVEDGLRSVEEPEIRVWYINHIACEGPPYNIPLGEWLGWEHPDPHYPDAEAVVNASADLIDRWLAEQ